MLDPHLLRQDLDTIAHELKRRGFELDTARLAELESQRKELQQKVEQLQASRNAGAKAIGQAKSKGEDATALLSQMEQVNQELKHNELTLTKLQAELQEIQAGIPNILLEDVPQGLTEEENVELDRWGVPPSFDFEPLDHVALGEKLNGLSGAAGVKITGARFSVLQGDIAKLHRALAQFMLSEQTARGYVEVNPPTIANSATLYGTTQLPKAAEDMFKLETEQEWYLAPTAEVTLTSLVADRILTEADLPLQFCAHTLCYRSEAGSYGKDTRGYIRQHQFEKVELVHMTKPEDSAAAHEVLIANAEHILQALELPYRKVVLCGGDTGFHARKTYDLEVWLPGQAAYREISSCSNIGDFQARRMGARFRREGQKKPELIHTLNGSGLAVGRTLVAVLENYQEADGRVRVPAVLESFMGKSYIEPASFSL